MKSTDYATRLTEAQFQEKVVALAKAKGWLVHHDRGDYRQCIAGDPGFPDLVLARGGVVIFAELKSETGRLSDAQRKWLDELPAYSEPGCAPSHHVRVWRPSDWPSIEELLNSQPGLEAL